MCFFTTFSGLSLLSLSISFSLSLLLNEHAKKHNQFPWFHLRSAASAAAAASGGRAPPFPMG